MCAVGNLNSARGRTLGPCWWDVRWGGLVGAGTCLDFGQPFVGLIFDALRGRTRMPAARSGGGVREIALEAQSRYCLPESRTSMLLSDS